MWYPILNPETKEIFPWDELGISETIVSNDKQAMVPKLWQKLHHNSHIK